MGLNVESVRARAFDEGDVDHDLENPGTGKSLSREVLTGLVGAGAALEVGETVLTVVAVVIAALDVEGDVFGTEGVWTVDEAVEVAGGAVPFTT